MNLHGFRSFLTTNLSIVIPIVGTRWDCGSAGINEAVQVQSTKTNYYTLHLQDKDAFRMYNYIPIDIYKASYNSYLSQKIMLLLVVTSSCIDDMITSSILLP